MKTFLRIVLSKMGKKNYLHLESEFQKNTSQHFSIASELSILSIVYLCSNLNIVSKNQCRKIGL